MTNRDVLFSFKGRISRTTWWLWTIALSAISVFVTALFILLYALFPDETIVSNVLLPANFVSVIPILWAGLALNVKRLHDRNRSGWFMLVVLIPVIGGLWLTIETGFLKGTNGPNRYGERADSRN